MSLIPNATSLPCPARCPTPQLKSCIARFHGLSDRVEKCARTTVLPLYFACVLFAISHPLDMRDRRLTSLNHFPLHPSFIIHPHLPPDSIAVRGVAVIVSPTQLLSFPPTPPPPPPHHHNHLLHFISALSMVVVGCSAVCKRGRTAHGNLLLSEPLAPVSSFDCGSCLDTRPCEHVRDSRMVSNLVSTQEDQKGLIVH